MQEGQPAPDFSLTDKEGVSYSLSGFIEPYVVLFFYPKDDTPGCTVEAKAFSDALAEFTTLGARVVGISGGTDETKGKFCVKHGLEVLLLSDTDFSVAKAYGVFGPKKFMGRTYDGIARQTFVLGAPNGSGERNVVKHFTAVTPASHVAEVRAFLARERE